MGLIVYIGIRLISYMGIRLLVYTWMGLLVCMDGWIGRWYEGVVRLLSLL